MRLQIYRIVFGEGIRFPGHPVRYIASDMGLGELKKYVTDKEFPGLYNPQEIKAVGKLELRLGDIFTSNASLELDKEKAGIAVIIKEGHTSGGYLIPKDPKERRVKSKILRDQ